MPAVDPDDDLPFRVGAKLRHARWGEGLLVGIQREGNDVIATVHFAKRGPQAPVPGVRAPGGAVDSGDAEAPGPPPRLLAARRQARRVEDPRRHSDRRATTRTTMSDVKITLAEVEHVARLARLALAADEKERMRSQLDAILGYVEQLRARRHRRGRGELAHHAADPERVPRGRAEGTCTDVAGRGPACERPRCGTASYFGVPAVSSIRTEPVTPTMTAIPMSLTDKTVLPELLALQAAGKASRPKEIAAAYLD